ncbi:MAG: site-2 protease family protein [Planctomycetales bacterium]|nr:site-2 protease family protein [Planctomycetales bacterium]
MKIATFGGIGVYIHWTFWVLIGYYLISSTAAGGLLNGLFAVAIILSVFACVVAHEFGHAAAAAHYGIRTADITLLPIGGVARLERLPEKPIQELVIAIAGPAVNVVIAGILFVLMLIGGIPLAMSDSQGQFSTMAMGYMDYLLIANIVLVLFNMLPAFPMDGGRVLRSLLAMRLGHLRATEVAARLGRWIALVFAIMAIFNWAPMLLLLAGFVFLAGTAELMSVRMRSLAGQEPMPGQGPMRGQTYGQWQVYAWPAQATTYEWQPRSEAYGPHRSQHLEDDVIDAIDVRHLPPRS